MLRSTGFFRGIDCPFYADNDESKSDKNGCKRPYCHFRHSQQRRASYGTAVDVKKQKELPAQLNSQGYDPFNPEVVSAQDQQNGEPSGDISGALELVNRAIEEVRSEVEWEKRKLSRIGDEEYEPSSTSNPSRAEAVNKRPSPTALVCHSAYDPGSYQLTSVEYNPTPRCSKYTLDSDVHGNHGNSMEYVPTSVKKPAPHRKASPPCSPKYSSNTSSKCKYIVDDSKPSTDMEYDPLSNFSARITHKHRKDEGPPAVTDGGRRRKLEAPQRPPADEEYVPTAKKPRRPSADRAPMYTVSDSEDGEGSGTEYRPTSISRLQQKKCAGEGSAQDVERTDGKERGERMTGVEAMPPHAAKVSPPGESDMREVTRRKDNLENEKAAARPAHGKNSKLEKVHRSGRDASKTPTGKSSSSSNSKDRGSTKKVSHNSSKKDGKSPVKSDGCKVRLKDKAVEKAPGEARDAKRSDGKVKPTLAKLKADSGKSEKTAENGRRDSKTHKTPDSDKDSGKHKDVHRRNGKLEGSRRDKDVKIAKGAATTLSAGKASSSSNKDSSVSRDKAKKSGRSLDGNVARRKDKRQTLSHADLFGDESPEEAEPFGEEEEDEVEEVLVRKSADAVKRFWKKRKAPEAKPSSSDEEEGEAHQGGADDCGLDFSGLQDLDFDSDPMEECLRIFNESKDVKREDKGRQAKQPSRESEEEDDTEGTLTTLFPGQKKRVSHFSAKGNSEALSRPAARPYRRPTAQEVCYQRMQMAQQQAAQLASVVRTAVPAPRTGPTPRLGSTPGLSKERKRIAHRPSTLAPPPPSSSSKPAPGDAKLALASRVLSSNRTLAAPPCVKAQTSAGILPKTASTAIQRRVAHTPTMKSSSMKRPVIPAEFGAKVPTNIRQRYLNIFIDECVKFCPSEDIAFQTGLDEEKMVYDRSSSKSIYLNVAVNTLKKLRSKNNSSSTLAKTAGSVSSFNRKAQSHEEVLGGRLAATTSFTLNRMGKQQEEKLTGPVLYRKLQAYLLTEEQLQEHCYPRPNPEASGRAIIFNLPEKKSPVDPFTKICCRCGAEYKININGSCVRKEECNHHWGRLRRHKVSGGWETSYSCCSGAVGSPGCQVVKQHVQDGRKESLDSYVQTFSKALPPCGNAGVYALDCEMCYTKLGLELTRVTVINSDLKVIYDTFVKPASKVVDYNTRFSGVTEEDLQEATITLRDVQAVLLSMFSAESVLIGHSLESDLTALKLIHSTVVDTAVVFPHRLGLPYKRALRNLMADHLKRIIQDNVAGHDSSEDASACMELMFWKLKEDAKVKR